MELAIRTMALTKRYGANVALDTLDLEVPRGVVFGYIGPNGAGKTTTIRLITGLLRPTSGGIQVLGHDRARDWRVVAQQIGYLPGEFAAYRDLTGTEYLRYVARLRGGVEWSQVELLAKRLDLDLDKRVGSLSHGNRQKVGVVQAFMHQPELLILDEPSQGLDPLVQREFLGLVREARDAGCTVFLSSHVLDEVEAVADIVAILRAGKLVVVDRVAALKARALRRIDLTFAGAPPVGLDTATGVRELEVVGDTAHVTVEGSPAELLRCAAPHGIERVVTHEVDLEEIFLTYYGQGA